MNKLKKLKVKELLGEQETAEKIKEQMEDSSEEEEESDKEEEPKPKGGDVDMESDYSMSDSDSEIDADIEEVDRLAAMAPDIPRVSNIPIVSREERRIKDGGQTDLERV